MTQEEKSLLLQDLCARLPYEVNIQVKEWTVLDTELKIGHINRLQNDDIELKPYLRPMLSMTEEEHKEFRKLKQMSITVIMPNGVSRIKPTYTVDLEDDGDGLNYLYDWLNSHYFDYRRLIERGLAIEAPEGMYKNY